MDQKELIQSGLDAVNIVIKYLAKDAVGSDFMNQYAQTRDIQQNAVKHQKQILNNLIDSSSQMEIDTRDIQAMTEDNITAHSQSGASGTFIHQHVLRAVNETWGSVINWSGNKATYTYKFNLDPSWKTDNLKVVAMISAYDQSDATKCEVENAAKTSIDPAVEVVDLNTLVQYIMTGRYDSKADLNHDNKVNAADLVLLINMVP